MKPSFACGIGPPVKVLNEDGGSLILAKYHESDD